MKVYVSGCHGSGKSSLARYISKQYNLPMISECARMILSEQELQVDSLRADLNVADKFQEDIFLRQLAEEGKYKSFVSDRCLLDVLAYSAQHTRILTKLLKHQDFNGYLEQLKVRNSFVFFVRPSKATLKEDGVRESLSWDGVVSIDGMLKLLFEMYEIRYFTINTDNMQERTKLIDAVLKDHVS